MLMFTEQGLCLPFGGRLPTGSSCWSLAFFLQKPFCFVSVTLPTPFHAFWEDNAQIAAAPRFQTFAPEFQRGTQM